MLALPIIRSVRERAGLPHPPCSATILDNAATHSSKQTKKVLAQMGERVVVHFLPPYCPEGSRVERVWWDAHANVTLNHRCKKMSALMAEVDAYLEARNAQQTASPLLRATTPRHAA
ncbi:transposase [Myxococcus sp. AM001]|nr:transposase [Myxococcus sp. AM001]